MGVWWIYKSLFSFLIIGVLILPHPAFARVHSDPQGSQWAYDLLRASEAWDMTQGSSAVVVAVIDNGIDIDHLDLRDNIWRNEDEAPDNGIDDDHNGYVDDAYGWNFVPDDMNGDGVIGPDENYGNPNVRPRVRSGLSESDRENINHATIVAGIIGARGDNGIDGAGINWHVKLMSIRVVDETGVSHAFVLGRAIRYAVDNGAHIINISLVGNAYDDELKSALAYAYDRGVAVVAAAGNTLSDLNTNPEYPVCADASSNVPFVVGVSAIQEGRRFAPFSNSGSTCIDVTAPGVNIASTVIYRPELGFTTSYVGGKRGTSYATPFVSGILALIKSVQPEWHAPELYDTLFTSVSKTTPTDEALYQTFFGRGLVQAEAALRLALSKRVTQAPTGLAFFVPGGDGGVYLTKNSGTLASLTNSVFKESSMVLTARATRAMYYMTFQNVQRDQTLLRVFGNDGSLRGERRLSIPTDTRFGVGFLTSTGTPDMVFWRKGKTANLFDVYSLSGIKKNSIKNTDGYIVKSVTTALQSASDLSSVYVLVEKNGEPRLLTVNADGTITANIRLAKELRLNDIVVGKIGNEGELRVVGVSDQKNAPKITYLTTEGAVIKTVLLDDKPSSFETIVRLIDLSGDEQPEVVVLSGGSRPVARVFDGQGRLKDSWRDGVPEQSKKTLQLVPLFEVPTL